jgi:hypothetical protein
LAFFTCKGWTPCCKCFGICFSQEGDSFARPSGSLEMRRSHWVPPPRRIPSRIRKGIFQSGGKIFRFAFCSATPRGSDVPCWCSECKGMLCESFSASWGISFYEEWRQYLGRRKCRHLSRMIPALPDHATRRCRMIQAPPDPTFSDSLVCLHAVGNIYVTLWNVYRYNCGCHGKRKKQNKASHPS